MRPRPAQTRYFLQVVHRTLTVVVGGQFGSEAKGKVCAYLAPEVDLAVRTGTPNAGHTIVESGQEWKMQQLPATWRNPDCFLAVGAGAFLDLEILEREVGWVGGTDRLLIDPLATVIEERHRQAEIALKQSIGSTGKGGGAALADRLMGQALLARDVLEGDYPLGNVSALAGRYFADNRPVLLEGTQGFGLSLLHGHYPYVTSRDTTAAWFMAEAGMPLSSCKEIIVVIRTFPIRVAGNSGPLPHETSWKAVSKKARRPVLERTTVTNKIRRVARFDPELVARAVMVNNPTQLALTFLDYLYPEDAGVSSWDDLSRNARRYISRLEKRFGVPVTLISTGAETSEMIDRR